MHAFFDQMAKVYGWIEMIRAEFIWVLIAYLVERKTTLFRNSSSFGENICRVHSFQQLWATKVALSIHIKLVSGLGYSNTQANRVKCVLKSLSRSGVHMNIAACNQRYPGSR